MADWQVGDLALCVKIGPWEYDDDGIACAGPKAGSVHRVTRVHPLPAIWLEGWGYSGDDAFCPSRFRKITPGAKIEGIEEPRRVKVDV